MDMETFDFSEALRRMKQGKKVKRNDSYLCYGFGDNSIIIYGCGTSMEITTIMSQDILATDWEEVN